MITASLRALVGGDRFIAAEAATLDEVLRLSDLVVLAARLTDEPRGMIGARELALLPRDAIFVNPTRAALARRAFAGATQEAAIREAEVVCRRVVAHLVDGILDGSLNRPALETAMAREGQR